MAALSGNVKGIDILLEQGAEISCDTILNALVAHLDDRAEKWAKNYKSAFQVQHIIWQDDLIQQMTPKGIRIFTSLSPQDVVCGLLHDSPFNREATELAIAYGAGYRVPI